MTQGEARLQDAPADGNVEEIEQLVLVRVMRLNAVVNGISLGLLFGVGLFLVTLILVIKGGEVVGPHLGLLAQFLPGYSVTLAGSFIGLAYGLLIGFAAGFFGAVIYNAVASRREASANAGQGPQTGAREARG